MSRQVIQALTIEDARNVAISGGGIYLVTDPATYQQIEAAEASGAFEGGMSGSAGGAPYSAQGYEGEPSSSAEDPLPVELLDAEDFIYLDGSAVFEAAGHIVELLKTVREVAHFFGERALGPIIIVPTEELQRWQGIADGA